MKMPNLIILPIHGPPENVLTFLIILVPISSLNCQNSKSKRSVHQEVRPSGSNGPSIPVKFDPENPPDWRQFCHTAGPEEKAEVDQYVPRPRARGYREYKTAQGEKDDGPALCNLCGKSYANAKNLTDHIKTAHTQQFTPCPVCGKTQRNLFGLRQHLQRMHKLSPAEAKEKAESLNLDPSDASIVAKPVKRPRWNDQSEVSCDICIGEGKTPKVYSTRCKLNTHIVNWHDTGTYLCVTCGASFDLRGKLRNHTASEHSEAGSLKARPCPHCSKVVKRLKAHITEVHGEKEECVCPHCAKVFHGMKPLRAHVRHTHDVEGKIFICHLCSKEFKNELSLKQHVRRQHDQMPAPEDYVDCPECGKVFATQLLLNSHTNAVHVVDNRKCGVCGGTYKNKYSLSKHMKNVHFGQLSSSKVGKGSYRMANTPTPVESKYEGRQKQQQLATPRYNIPPPPFVHQLPHPHHFGSR